VAATHTRSLPQLKRAAADSSFALYWSRQGEVACISHTPEPGDLRWVAEGWEPIPASYVGLRPGRYQCQHCSLEQAERPPGRAM